MLTSIDFGRVESALATPAGWIELGLALLCFAVGWAVDRRFSLTRDDAPEVVRVGLGGVNRLIFPLVSLALVVGATALFAHFRPAFFLAAALPLVIALALIRLIVYALRGIFGNAPWMKTSERAISFSIWVFVILYFLGVLQDVGAQLDAMQIPLGRSHVSVLELGKGVLVVIVTIAAALWLSGLIERRLIRAGAIDLNLRVVLSKFVRVVLLVIGLLFALQAVGMDLTLLSVFGGALGVGIGLGLQKLASNYIAGFTILLDRSVRMGDMITVDGRHGIVTSVTSRYVVVRSLDGVEAIVPNETLVTTTVLNHSYTSKNVRVALTLQISYDSDIDLALKIMTDAANAQERVLKAPSAPVALVVRFAENGIDLELGFWVGDPENGQGELRSAIYRAIFSAFKQHGIRIPFPQRETRILEPSPPVAAPNITASSRADGSAG
jgi:small-conductance mechanosensitive channel